MPETDNSNIDPVTGYQTQVFNIPDFRLDQAIGNLKKLSAKAKSLGMPAFKMELGDAFLVNANGQYGRTGGKLRIVPLSVTGGPPMLSGWRFFAKIDHDEGMNIVQGFGASDAVEKDPDYLAELQACPPACEHCNVSRKRKTTFLFESTDEPGKRIQVGSTCVDDFSGHKSPDQIVAMATRWADLIREFLDDEEDGYGSPSLQQLGFDVNQVLTAACAVVRHHGHWVSRDAQTEYGSSADWVQQLIVDEKSFQKLTTKGDHAEADQIAQWLQSDSFETEGSLYRGNLRALAMREAVPFKMVGFLASSVATWHRDQAIIQDKMQNPDVSIKLGEPGEKLTINARAEKIIPIDTHYGMSDLVIFKDNETQGKLVWFNSGRRWMTEGDNYKVTGTVKEHSERDSIMQTKLTRTNSAEAALSKAIESGAENNKLFQKKLKATEFINSRNGKGATPLYEASYQHQVTGEGVDIIKALIDAGADPTIPCKRDDMTPFDHWVVAGESDLIRYGLEHHPELARPWHEVDLSDVESLAEEDRNHIAAVRQQILVQDKAAETPPLTNDSQLAGGSGKSHPAPQGSPSRLDDNPMRDMDDDEDDMQEIQLG